tara:strand:+ start:346 stop:528 length:183 start_codon:yes stop_codon:yes gene_type:complete
MVKGSIDLIILKDNMEFVAKNGNLIKCYWDEEKGDWRRSIIENIVSIKPIKNKKRKKGKK